MQQVIALPHIKSSLVAAAITVATFAIMSGSASATEMHPTQHHENPHAVAMQEGGQEHEAKKHQQGSQEHEANKHQQESNSHENKDHENVVVQADHEMNAHENKVRENEMAQNHMNAQAAAMHEKNKEKHENKMAHKEHKTNGHEDRKMNGHDNAEVKHANKVNGDEHKASSNGNNQHQANANKNHEAQQEAVEQSQAAIDLRVGLNNLLREHVTTNLNVNRSIATDASTAEIEAGIGTQMANTEDLAGAVGSVYGSEAQAQFSEMFAEHIEESNNIAIAVAAGDESAKQMAVVELEEYLDEITTFFTTAIPVLPYDAVYGLLSDHEDLINRSTEAAAAGNFELSYHLERKALVQVSTIADALASGIIATQPDKF